MITKCISRVLIGSLLSVMVAGIANASGNNKKYDIKGLRLNMPIKEAKMLLSRERPPYRIRLNKGDVSGIRGSRIRGLRYDAYLATDFRNKPDYSGDQFAVEGFAPPNAGVVGYIHRFGSLGPDKEVPSKKFGAFLVRKYGKLLFVDKPNPRRPYHVFSWSTYDDGKPIRDRGFLEYCIGYRSVNHFTSPMADSREIDLRSKEKCGLIMVVLAGGDNRYVRGFYHMFLFDYPAILRNNAKTIEYTKKIARKLDAERERKASKASMPDL